MKVIACKPGKKAVVKELEGLEAMQQTVGGYIEAIYPFRDPVAIVCNDYGKFNGSEPNRALFDDRGNMYDVIYGTFFICGLGEEDFASLSDELVVKYLHRFGKPEYFISIASRLIPVR